VIGSAARLLWRALNRFFQHNGPDRAAAVAYYTLLSLIPLLIFLISLGVMVLGSFDRAYAGTMFLVGGVVVHLDPKSLESLRAFVERATRFQWGGILLLAWTSKRIFAALFSALETVFEVPGRGFAGGNIAALTMVFVTGTGLLCTLALTTVVAGVEGTAQRFAGAAAAEAVHSLQGFFLGHVVPPLITAVFFFILYRVVPRRTVSTVHAATGALLATVLWEAAKTGFAYYIRNLAHYAGLYGALEAIIVLGLWLELSVSIILFCGEIVALLLPARAPSPAPLTALPATE
jgi:membrane protein